MTLIIKRILKQVHCIMPKISVIIPAYNEGKAIGQTVQYVLKQAGDTIRNILVVYGGSSDNNINKEKQEGEDVLHMFRSGRAGKMKNDDPYVRRPVIYYCKDDSLT